MKIATLTKMEAVMPWILMVRVNGVDSILSRNRDDLCDTRLCGYALYSYLLIDI
jgi:hypothetical protein